MTRTGKQTLKLFVFVFSLGTGSAVAFVMTGGANRVELPTTPSVGGMISGGPFSLSQQMGLGIGALDVSGGSFDLGSGTNRSSQGTGAAVAPDLSATHVFPVPFRASVHSNITFSGLPESYTIRIYNLSGVLIRTIIGGSPSGTQVWDVANEAGEPAASGMYLWTVEFQGKTVSGKLMVVR